PVAGAGTSNLVFAGGTERVRFKNLAPVLDTVAGPLAVNGTNASNAILYTVGSTAANGMVTVDDFESIEFTNKTTLALAGLPGNDTIGINNPNTPTGLTAITADGGTGFDTLNI